MLSHIKSVKCDKGNRCKVPLQGEATVPLHPALIQTHVLNNIKPLNKYTHNMTPLFHKFESTCLIPAQHLGNCLHTSNYTDPHRRALGALGLQETLHADILQVCIHAD